MYLVDNEKILFVCFSEQTVIAFLNTIHRISICNGAVICSSSGRNVMFELISTLKGLRTVVHSMHLLPAMLPLLFRLSVFFQFGVPAFALETVNLCNKKSTFWTLFIL